MRPWRVIALAGVILAMSGAGVCAQDHVTLWQEFVAGLKAGTITEDQIRPYDGVNAADLTQQLRLFQSRADSTLSWNEWDNVPEVFPVGDQVHFITALGQGDTTKIPYCFTFVIDRGKWYYRHLESIFIRLDRTPSPPTSDFPDLPPAQKAWQREEMYWSQIVYFYTVLAKDKGKDYFLNLLKDGAGYALAAKAWVPFFPPSRAFILYVCWEQSRLRENAVELISLSDDEAVVKLQSHFFYLYKIAGHLKQQISFDDYLQIFDTIWQDRATNAGWKLQIACVDAECLQCTMRFTRSNE